MRAMPAAAVVLAGSILAAVGLLDSQDDPERWKLLSGVDLPIAGLGSLGSARTEE